MTNSIQTSIYTLHQVHLYSKASSLLTNIVTRFLRFHVLIWGFWRICWLPSNTALILLYLQFYLCYCLLRFSLSESQD